MNQYYAERPGGTGDVVWEYVSPLFWNSIVYKKRFLERVTRKSYMFTHATATNNATLVDSVAFSF